MRTFQDNQKRTWEVAITVDAVKRVRSLLDVDLLGLMEGKLLERLVTDPILLCDIIYVVCKPHADRDGISDEDFGRAMAGDAIDDATTAVLEELADFFPKGRREVLRKALEKITKLEQMAMDAAAKVLDSGKLERQLQADLDAEIESAMQSSEPPNAGDSSTDSQAPSESTQAP